MIQGLGIWVFGFDTEPMTDVCWVTLALSVSTEKKVIVAVSGWTTGTQTQFLHDLPLFNALQETDNWTTSVM